MSDRRSLIVVDVETTGLDISRHWPIEVKAINLTTDEFLYFVPALPVGALDNASGAAMKINRYFERGVYANRLNKPDNENVWLQLWEMLSGNTLGGSNPTFDAGMLNKGYEWAAGTGTSSPWHHRLADLAAYAGAALHLGPHELLGLSDVCAALGVDNAGPHSAAGDAAATAECFRQLTERYTVESVIGATK